VTANAPGKEHDMDKNRTDEIHTDKNRTDKIVELNTEETEQVVGGKHVNVTPVHRVDPLPMKK
jgi:hypothetical protein